MANKPTAKNKKRVVDVNRDILAKLSKISATKGKTIIDFEKALKYPLGDIPLSLANADGTTSKTNKRKHAKQKTAFIVDLTSCSYAPLFSTKKEAYTKMIAHATRVS